MSIPPERKETAPRAADPFDDAARALLALPIIRATAPMPYASFTTLVVPFWYELSPSPNEAEDGRRWSRQETHGSEWQSRRSYFTEETGRAMYDRALHLNLNESLKDNETTVKLGVWRSAILPIPSCTDANGFMPEPSTLLHIGIDLPKLLLFEGRSATEQVNAPALHVDHLSVGMIILTVRILEAADHLREDWVSRTPTVAEQLLVNERLRFLRQDHPGFWGNASRPLDGRAFLGAHKRGKRWARGFWRQIWEKQCDPISGTWERLWSHGDNQPNDSEEDIEGKELFDGWANFLKIPIGPPGTENGPTLHLRPQTTRGADKQDATWDAMRGWTTKADEQRLGTPCPSRRSNWHAVKEHRAFAWACLATEAPKHAANEDATAAPHESSGDGMVQAENSPDSSVHFMPAAKRAIWRRLLNADVPDSDQTHIAPESAASERWLLAHTYDRWAHAGSYHGFCTHGGGTWVSDFDKAKHVPEAVATLYLDMVLLLLFNRCVTFSLSDELSWQASRRGERSASVDRSTDQQLRRIFDYFSNVYRFPLLSNQQQGIELYALAREAMDIEPLVNDIKEQIATTDSLLQARASISVTRQQTELTRRQTLFGLLAFLIAIPPILGGIMTFFLEPHTTAGKVGAFSSLSVVTLLIFYLLAYPPDRSQGDSGA